MPWGLARAQLVDGLCQRWGCLPSQLLKEDANVILQILTVIARESPGQPPPVVGQDAPVRRTGGFDESSLPMVPLEA